MKRDRCFDQAVRPKAALLALAMATVGPLVIALTSDGATANKEPLVLQYTIAPGCPGEITFRSQVLARTSKVEFVAHELGVSTRTVNVKLLRTGKRWTGHLKIVATDGSETDRDVDADTCDEVVAALALVAALTVDPQAAIAPTAEPTASTTATATATTTSTTGASATTTAVATARASSAAPSPSGRWEEAVLVRGGATSSLGGVAPSLGGGVEVRLRDDSGARVLPSVRFQVGYAWAVGDAVDGVSARTTTVTLRATVCPHRFVITSGLTAELCGAFEGGILRAEGVGVVEAHTETRPWFAVAGLGRIGWTIGGPLFVEIEGGAGAPLIRDRFLFSSSTFVQQVPIAYLEGAGALGWRW